MPSCLRYLVIVLLPMSILNSAKISSKILLSLRGFCLFSFLTKFATKSLTLAFEVSPSPSRAKAKKSFRGISPLSQLKYLLAMALEMVEALRSKILC